MTRALLSIFLLLLASACSSGPRLPEGLDELETARTFFEMGRYRNAAAVAGAVQKDEEVSIYDRAEAAFLAGEAQLAQGNHLKALKHYKYVLENAPWSEHSAAIEDRLFQIADAFFHDPKYGGTIWLGGLLNKRHRGVQALETAQAFFRRSDRADDALHLIAEHFVEIKAWEEAAFTYERLFEEYPDSEWIEHGLWQAGRSRMMLSRGPEYARDDLLRAQGIFQRSLDTFPKGMRARDVETDIAFVRERLAEYELLVADFYRNRGEPEGERIRLVNAYLLYPNTLAGEAAQQRLEAMGVDFALLKDNPSLTAVDNVVPGRVPWADR